MSNEKLDVNEQLDENKKREQFKKVIDHLTSLGYKKKEIAINIGSDAVQLSKILSDRILRIEDYIIDGLKEEYGINPKYITHGASNMYDVAGLKYENFEKFVYSWEVVEHENDPYLCFKMDPNFYNFLIDVYSQKNTYSNNSDENKFHQAFCKTAKEYLESNSNSKSKKGIKIYDSSISFSSMEKLYSFFERIINKMGSSFFSEKTPKDEQIAVLKNQYEQSKSVKEYVLIPYDIAYEIAKDNEQKRVALSEVVNVIELKLPKK